MFFASNADSYSAVADTKCNHTCSFVYGTGGFDICDAFVRCCQVEDLPCTTDEPWEVKCYGNIDS